MKGKTFRIENERVVTYIEGMAQIEFAGDSGGLQRGARTKVLEKIMGEYIKENPIDDVLRKSYAESLEKIEKETAEKITELEKDAKENKTRFEEALSKLPAAKDSTSDPAAGKKTGSK